LRKVTFFLKTKRLLVKKGRLAKMWRKFLVFLFLVFFSFSLVSWGRCEEVRVIDKQKIKQAEKDIQKLFPKFKVETMVRVPITELYLVVADDGGVILYSPAGFVFLGDVWNMKGESLIAKVYEGVLEKLLEEKDGRFFVKVGSGKHKVIAFLSFSSEDGRNIFRFLREKRGLELYVFPVVFNERDVQYISYIYCAKDREKAMNEVFEGRVDVGKVSIDEGCKKKGTEVAEINLRVANRALIYSGDVVLIGDKRIIGYQPFEIMKALYFVGWREGNGR
jgi:hypothetical protein